MSGTSLQSIADRLGVTKAAVYHLIACKDDIALAVAEPVIERLLLVAAMSRALDTNDWKREIPMPIDHLDALPALIVIDLQRGTLSNPMMRPRDELLANVTELLTAFRTRRLPVVLANVDGTPAGRNDCRGPAREYPAEFTELVPELKQQPADLTVTRRAWSAFAGTDLDATLSALGVTQVVIAGVATSFGVESTARHAYDSGYHVVLAVDAITDFRAESHENSVTRVFPVLGQTGSTAEIVAQLPSR